MTDYDNNDRIAIFKNTNTDNEKAPQWSGNVTLSQETIDGLGSDRTFRVALWKTYPKNGGKSDFFLAGKAELPNPEYSSKSTFDDDDEWG